MNDTGSPAHEPCEHPLVSQRSKTRGYCERCALTRPAAPIVTAKAVERGTGHNRGVTVWVIDCPHCGREHRHGAGEGHRVSHCRALHNPGYILRGPDSEADR